jgi:hypothetical protein
MALSGWGLTPGTLEKNVTRSLGGKYGAVGNDSATIGDMMRQKYAAGLQAKQAKEGFDITRTAEANRKAESDRRFGLDTEKFGFEKTDATRARDLQEEAMRGGWSQQDLDRAFREQQLLAESGWRSADRAQSASEYDQSLDLQNRELLSLDEWRKRQMEEEAARQLTINNSADRDYDFKMKKYQDEQKQLQLAQRSGSGYASSGGSGGANKAMGSQGYRHAVGQNGQIVYYDIATGEPVSRAMYMSGR